VVWARGVSLRLRLRGSWGRSWRGGRAFEAGDSPDPAEDRLVESLSAYVFVFEDHEGGLGEEAGHLKQGTPLTPLKTGWPSRCQLTSSSSRIMRAVLASRPGIWSRGHPWPRWRPAGRVAVSLRLRLRGSSGRSWRAGRGIWSRGHPWPRWRPAARVAVSLRLRLRGSSGRSWRGGRAFEAGDTP